MVTTRTQVDPSFRDSLCGWRTGVFSLDRKWVASLLVAYIYIRIKLVMPCFCTVLCTRTCRFFKSLYVLKLEESARRVQLVGGGPRRPPTILFFCCPTWSVAPSLSVRFSRRKFGDVGLSLIRLLLIRMFEEKKKQLCSFIFAEQIKELTCNYVFFLIALQ